MACVELQGLPGRTVPPGTVLPTLPPYKALRCGLRGALGKLGHMQKVDLAEADADASNAVQRTATTPATGDPGIPRFEWTNRFRGLGPAFFTELDAQGLPAPHWVAASDDCAALLGLPADWQTRPSLDAVEVFSGNRLLPGMQTLASVYSGHQFGVWAGQLGDGRAL